MGVNKLLIHSNNRRNIFKIYHKVFILYMLEAYVVIEIVLGYFGGLMYGWCGLLPVVGLYEYMVPFNGIGGDEGLRPAPSEELPV